MPHLDPERPNADVLRAQSTKWTKDKLRNERVYSGSAFKGTAHRGREVMTKDLGSWPHCTHNQKAKGDEYLYPAPFLLFQFSLEQSLYNGANHA